ncbi:MAG: type II 3-dehydroquinate dehydratase [Beijerinckiaceae bacterium]
MTKPIYILNGPNLNMLGVREPHIYGTETLADIEKRSAARALSLGFSIDFRQSNYEGKLVDWVQEAREQAAAIIINPAGLSFFSIPLLNALEMFDGVKIEIHLSNLAKREDYYQKSLISKTVMGHIAGFGGDVYVLAVEAAAMKLARATS